MGSGGTFGGILGEIFGVVAAEEGVPGVPPEMKVVGNFWLGFSVGGNFWGFADGVFGLFGSVGTIVGQLLGRVSEWNVKLDTATLFFFAVRELICVLGYPACAFFELGVRYRCNIGLLLWLWL